jgi:hypothetical protein
MGRLSEVVPNILRDALDDEGVTAIGTDLRHSALGLDEIIEGSK